MRPKNFLQLGKKAVLAWVDDLAPSMGAAISYYTMFSLAPLLVIVIAVAGLLFGREAVEGEIVTQLTGLVGRDGALAVQGMVSAASDTDRGLVAGAISIVVLVIGATSVFGELQSALDRIWHVPEKAKPSGLWALVRARLLSFGLILGLAFLLMVSLVVSAGVAAFGTWAGGLLPGQELLLHLLNIAVSLAITTLLFAMIFKLMPTAKIDWHDVWIGAFVTAVLFEVGKLLIGLYLGKSGVSESFAAAGSVVVLLAWVYYAAQIFLLGAEFTKVYASEHGSAAGVQAIDATKEAAAVQAAGTDRVGGGGTETLQPVQPVGGPAAAFDARAPREPAASAGRIVAGAQVRGELDRRTRHQNAALLRLLLLGAFTVSNIVAKRWTREQRKGGAPGARAGATPRPHSR